MKDPVQLSNAKNPIRTSLPHALTDLQSVALIAARQLAIPLLLLGAGLLLMQPCAATPFQWEYTGSLNTARYHQTATLLPNGEVLVVDGFDEVNVILASAELYDPATGTWTVTGSPNTARFHHTATLLADGKVLVVGGAGVGGYLASAELYDPATGNWTDTGSLNTARFRHTATLLADSKVLVTGGDGPRFLASAELYDPATGDWTDTGSLNTLRTLHTATLLADGKVLVVGGYNNGIIFAKAELYDPVTGTWTFTGSLNTGRYFHTATLLSDGRVLVAGGVNGGASAELYDAATGNWTVTGSLNTARFEHTATLLPNGEVLAVAGWDGLTSFASAELYDPGIVAATQVQGRGLLDNQGNEVTFMFSATQADESGTIGHFNFCDPVAGVCITNAGIRNLSITGNSAHFSGAQLQEGTEVKFKVSVTDNGSPGTSDTISITMSNGYSLSGTLIRGDIRIF